MSLSKAEIRRALRQACEAEFAAIAPEAEIDYTFSPAFCRRMDALIAEEKRGSWRLLSRTGRRIAIVAAVLVLALLLVACSPRLRSALAGLTVEAFDRFVSVKATSPQHRELETLYAPTYLPEGYTPESFEQSSPYVSVWCCRGADNEVLTFRQVASVVYEGHIQREDLDYYADTVDGTEVFFALSETLSSAIWSYDGYRMQIICIGSIDRETLDEMIRSLRPVE